MNIRHIEVFKAIMDTGSVTEAAKTLNVTQPSVSKHLKLFEYALGFQLFMRAGNRLHPTPEGHALYDQIDQLYTGMDHLQSFAEDLKYNRQGEITIASMPMLAQNWLPKKMATFLSSSKRVSVSFPVQSSHWIMQSVAARQADFGLGLTPTNVTHGINIRPLMSIPLVAVIPKDHRLAEHRFISVENLEKEDVITVKNFDRWRFSLEGVLAWRKFKPERYIDTFSTHMAHELANNGVGIALIDLLTASSFGTENLSIKRFEPELFFEISIMTPEHWPLTQLAAQLINDLSEQAKKTEIEIRTFI